MPDEARLEVSVVEAEVVVLPEDEEGFQAVGAHPGEAPEGDLVQAQTGELQEEEDADLAVVVEATKSTLHPCLHVAYAAFEEIPIKDLWLGVTADWESSVPLYQFKDESDQKRSALIINRDVTLLARSYGLPVLIKSLPRLAKNHFTFLAGADLGPTSSQPQTRSQKGFWILFATGHNIHPSCLILNRIPTYSSPLRISSFD